MEEKITIIIPIYNAEKWLEKCLNSIINQTYKNIEILLINDGSTDNSLQICCNYENNDKRIKVINKKNEGVSIARNIGIKEANGKYIKFVDSDDWLEPNTCEKLLSAIKEENTDLVICGLNIYKNNEILRRPHLNKRIVEIKKNIKEFEYISKVFASPCNKLYKKEKITTLFNESMSSGEDLLFNLKYLQNIDKISIIEDCLYNVCLDNTESLNRSFREDKLDITLMLIEEQIKFCNQTYGRDVNNSFFYNMYIENVHAHFRMLAKKYKLKQYRASIKKYMNNNKIMEASKKCELQRKDYKIFNLLLRWRNRTLMYLFFKMKIIMTKK